MDGNRDECHQACKDYMDGNNNNLGEGKYKKKLRKYACCEHAEDGDGVCKYYRSKTVTYSPKTDEKDKRSALLLIWNETVMFPTE